VDEYQEQNKRAELLKLWREYGKTYHVFVPVEQPDPHDWDRELPKPDDKGTFDPQGLKHWRYFERTRDFLRERYTDHGILAGPALIFDCLVPKFQKPLDIPADKRKQYKLPKQGDPPEWYDKVLRIIITSQGEVGFVCNSEDCQRRKCKLNLQNENRISPCDLFSLVQIFHGHRFVATAKAIVAEEFGKLGKFEARGIQEKPKIERYAVPKHEIYALISRYSNMRRQHVPQLVNDATELIRSCDLRQEEAARKNQWGLDLTDAEIGRQWDVTRKAIGKLRQELQELGLLKIKGRKWTVGY
jgi:hypothetical protein